MAHPDDMKGKVKEGAGKVSGDESLEREGERDQAKGKIKEAGEKLKDAFSDKDKR